MKTLMLAVLILFLTATIAAQAAPPVRRIVIFDVEIVNEPAQDALLEALGVTVLNNLPIVNGKAVLLPPQAEAALGRIAGVVRIDPDVIVSTLAPPPGKGKPSKDPEPEPDEILPWGVDRIDADLIWETVTGIGVKVGVVDTGIDLDHPDLQANIAGDVNIINPNKTGDDDNGHGTHVAGTVAAIDNDIGVIGVGPGTSLYAVKVLDRRGSGFLSDVIAGLQWCIVNNMQVVNMSLGTSRDIQSFHDAVIVVNAAGIIQVAAAGNASGGPVGYPAAYAEVIAVSATDSGDVIASFSSVGPEVELAAPGVEIPSTWKKGGYNTISGTSMACPHVTGAAALALAAGIAAIDVRTALQTSADDLGVSDRDNEYGYGLVDAEEVVTGVPTMAPPQISHITPANKSATAWGRIKNQ